MAPLSLERIVVGVDGSQYGENALSYGIDLTRRFGGRLTVLTVAPLTTFAASTEPWVPTEVLEGEVRHYQGILDTAVKRAQNGGVAQTTGVLLEGHVLEEIVGFLEKNPTDLLILGSHGRTAAKRILLGSTSDAVLHHVNCPVLIVREPRPGSVPRPEPSPEGTGASDSHR
ncbi:MAG: universal stress protein [Thermoplasmata archaeon]